jgi:carbamoyl-phosphate synthase large subunit
MKATGEVMAIDRSFEAALLKGVRSLEQGTSGLLMPEMSMLEDDELCRRLREPDDQRLFVIGEALRRGMTVERIQELSRIDAFFLRKMQRVVEMATRLGKEELSPDLLRQAKRMGFADAEIAALRGVSEGEVRACRRAWGIVPTYKMVDTCAAEFEAQTPYFYSTCEREDEAACQPGRRRVLVVGAGPIRIGQGVEFDYCSVHCVWALREAGVEAIIVNNNPETVSTDFDTSDRLYFEPLAFEDVMNVIDEERPEGAIVQFGGQTAINLARPLQRAGVPILGTSCEDIDRAENRDLFDALLESLGIARPPGGAATSVEEGLQVGRRVGFPALVRPSYVLGGRAMEIVDDEQQLAEYMRTAVMVSPEHPVLVDRYLVGDEIEVDAVCDGETVLIPGIMQHVERAGVHSGDSIAVYPAYSLGPRVEAEIVDVTTRLARALNVRGLLNIQFVLHEGRLYVLEVNPRSSRTVPFLSKVTGIPMVKLATEVMLGKSLHQLGYQGGLQAAPPFFAVKVPVFSFSKLSQVDISLGPEMKSTGEVMGIDACFEKALHKGFLAAGVSVPESGVILATVADRDKEEAIPILRGFYQLGFSLLATAGTARALEAAGMKVERVNKLGEGSPTIVDLIRQDRVDMVVNTLTRGRQPASDGFQIRRAAVELGIACLTSLDTARAVLRVVQDIRRGKEFGLMALQEYLA